MKAKCIVALMACTSSLRVYKREHLQLSEFAKATALPSIDDP